MDNLRCVGRGPCIAPRSPGEGITISWVLFSIFLEPRAPSPAHITPSHPTQSPVGSQFSPGKFREDNFSFTLC